MGLYRLVAFDTFWGKIGLFGAFSLSVIRSKGELQKPVGLSAPMCEKSEKRHLCLHPLF